MVLAKSVELGEVVVVNQPLFKVGDVTRLILEVSVDEADIGARARGRGAAPASVVAVSLYAFPKQIQQGHVFEVLPDANRDRKAFLVKVKLDTPPVGLRSGMSAEVNIIAGEQDGALLAPSDSSRRRRGLARSTTAARTSSQSRWAIRNLLRVRDRFSGLAEGDLVVVSGQDKLTEGMRVSAAIRAPDKFEPMPDRSQPGQSAIR